MNTLKEVILFALTVYAVTLIFTKSEVFFWARRRARMMLGLIPVTFLVRRFKDGETVLIDEDDLSPEEYQNSVGYDAVSCRMCVGFWVTVVVCVASLPLSLWLPVYGLSYFLATQERS